MKMVKFKLTDGKDCLINFGTVTTVCEQDCNVSVVYFDGQEHIKVAATIEEIEKALKEG